MNGAHVNIKIPQGKWKCGTYRVTESGLVTTKGTVYRNSLDMKRRIISNS